MQQYKSTFNCEHVIHQYIYKKSKPQTIWGLAVFLQDMAKSMNTVIKPIYRDAKVYLGHGAEGSRHGEI